LGTDIEEIDYGSGDIKCIAGSDTFSIGGLILNDFEFFTCFDLELTVSASIDGVMGFAYSSIDSANMPIVIDTLSKEGLL